VVNRTNIDGNSGLVGVAIYVLNFVLEGCNSQIARSRSKGYGIVSVGRCIPLCWVGSFGYCNGNSTILKSMVIEENIHNTWSVDACSPGIVNGNRNVVYKGYRNGNICLVVTSVSICYPVGKGIITIEQPIGSVGNGIVGLNGYATMGWICSNCNHYSILIETFIIGQNINLHRVFFKRSCCIISCTGLGVVKIGNRHRGYGQVVVVRIAACR